MVDVKKFYSMLFEFIHAIERQFQSNQGTLKQDFRIINCCYTES